MGAKYNFRNARLTKTKAIKRNNGRNTCNEVNTEIQALLIPNESNTSGPIQQAEAPIADKIAPSPNHLK